jgi:hypothetical protein
MKENTQPSHTLSLTRTPLSLSLTFDILMTSLFHLFLRLEQ